MGLFRDYRLSRRGVDVSDHEVKEIAQWEISGSDELRGYRAVWHSPRFVVVVVVYGGLAQTQTKKKPQIKKRKTQIKRKTKMKQKKTQIKKENANKKGKCFEPSGPP